MSRIAKVIAEHEKYNIFTSIRKCDALKTRIAESERSNLPLKGTLCAIKDNICTTEEPTTCASKILKNFTAPYNATVVDLLTQSGAVIVGKANLDEFGMGADNAFSHFGQTYSPKYPNEQRVAGGSSGGSAAAVAAETCDFALGTDTGGSVRLPAAYCGVVGYKPSYGRVSRHGVIPYSNSLDTVGILGSNVDTVDQVFNVLDTYDAKDPTCLQHSDREKIFEFAGKAKDSKITIGLVDDYLIAGMDEANLRALKQCVTQLMETYNCEVEAVRIPSLKYSLPTYFTLSYSEGASNFARFDGIRYGKTESDPADATAGYAEIIKSTRSSGFGPEVQKRILVGNYNLSSGKFENNFVKAARMRTQIRTEFDNVFRMRNALSQNTVTGNVDFLLTPVTFSEPPRAQDLQKIQQQNPMASYVNDALLVPSSLAALPSISLPFGDSSIQVIGQFGNDEGVLDFAKKIESLQKK